MSATSIARALGGRKSGRGFVLRCVSHEDRSPSLSIADGDDGRLLVRCHAGCDSRDVLAELRRRGLLDDGYEHDHHNDRHAVRWQRQVAPADDEARGFDFAMQIWREGAALPGSPAETYLITRLGFVLDDLADVRFHSRCPRGRDRLPAMVALMRDARTDQPTGIHRTFIRADGSGKADVPPAKMMLGRAGGSVVKLTADSEVTLGLGISEGIEDGIAIINAGWRPVWACLSTSGMAALPVLYGIEALTVFADADSPGRKAAFAAVANWRLAGREAVVAEPPAGLKDFAEAAHA